LKDDSFYLRHILECIRLGVHSTSRGRYGQRDRRISWFPNRSRRRRAEPASPRGKHPAPVRRLEGAMAPEWTRIAAFRNVLVHDYLGLDMERIWLVTQLDVPELKKSVELMLSPGPDR
jgi:uncharacterized protein with HEPN domain